MFEKLAWLLFILSISLKHIQQLLFTKDARTPDYMYHIERDSVTFIFNLLKYKKYWKRCPQFLRLIAALLFYYGSSRFFFSFRKKWPIIQIGLHLYGQQCTQLLGDQFYLVAHFVILLTYWVLLDLSVFLEQFNV